MIVGVKFKAKFTNSSNQYYLYCIHYGNEDKATSTISSGCKSFIYAKYKGTDKEKKLYIKNLTTDHTGHAKYTEMELLDMMTLNDVREDIKTRAQGLFENGETCIEINSTLQKEFPKNK